MYFLAEFILPALTALEKKFVFPAIFASFGLFLLGVLVCYFWLLPKTILFFFRDTQSLGWTPTWTVQQYYSFVTRFTIGFGLGFELPVVVLALVRFGLITYRFMARTRPYAVVLIFILATIITPTPDILTLVAMAMPAEGLSHLELVGELTSDTFLILGARPDIHAAAWAAHACWLLGRDEDALASTDRAISTARAIEHPYNLALALAYAAVGDQMRGDLPRLRSTVGELRELCDRYDFAYYREWGLILDGWSRMDGSGIDLAQQGIGNLKAEGSFARMPYCLASSSILAAR